MQISQMSIVLLSIASTALAGAATCDRTKGVFGFCHGEVNLPCANNSPCIADSGHNPPLPCNYDFANRFQALCFNQS
ncbi:unnamed protein product [Zymoseptoria tritici ST99CH_3D1]|nr:unnamed protein product [Zymoseptoria tritici ST99CH_3D1]